LAGSFFVESLTDELEKKALNYIQRIDDLFTLKRWRAGVLDGIYSSASLDALQ
jgi:methylmalonyl-CoA mutase N-terminal domain/subunit